MKSFEKLCERLIKMEELREPPSMLSHSMIDYKNQTLPKKPTKSIPSQACLKNSLMDQTTLICILFPAHMQIIQVRDQEDLRIKLILQFVKQF